MERRYIPEWEKDFLTAPEFAQRFDRIRDIFGQPVTTVYRALAAEHIPAGRVLSLGIGNGYVERLLGIDQKDLEGLNVNPHLLKRAQNRFPKARMHLGRFAQVLPKLKPFDTIFTGEVLDCVNPTEVGDIMKIVRDKCNRLVLVQSCEPNDEFYHAYSANPNTGSKQGPGISGWTEEQIALVNADLETAGITSVLPQAEALVDQIQAHLEATNQSALVEPWTAVTDRLRFPYQRNPLPGFFDQPYPGQIVAFLEYLKHQAQLWSSPPPFVKPSFFANPDYIPKHTFTQWTSWMEYSTQIGYYFTLIEDACKKAGFSDLRRMTINADGDQVIGDPDMIQRLNRALAYTDPGYHHEQPRRDIKKEHQVFASQMFIDGLPARFIQPEDNSFNAFRLHCLIAD